MLKRNPTVSSSKQRIKGLLSMWKVEITDPKMLKICLYMYRAGAMDQHLTDQMEKK